jgi:glycosyltransferase involved in cell wall biosynthesis
VTLIENVAESHQVDSVPEEEVDDIRRRLDLVGKRVVLYVGTFETYQGLGMLLEATRILEKDRDDTVFLLVGGNSEQVESIKTLAAELGVARYCRFTGTVPHSSVPAFLKVADVLVSPRRFGTNTPLKIYSYLRSGRPIVATNLYTHAQVLDRDTAVLVEPEPAALAAGIAAVLDNPARGKELADAAFRLSEEKYSYRVYVERTRELYEHIERIRHDRR